MNVHGSIDTCHIEFIASSLPVVGANVILLILCECLSTVSAQQRLRHPRSIQCAHKFIQCRERRNYTVHMFEFGVFHIQIDFDFQTKSLKYELNLSM